MVVQLTRLGSGCSPVAPGEVTRVPRMIAFPPPLLLSSSCIHDTCTRICTCMHEYMYRRSFSPLLWLVSLLRVPHYHRGPLNAHYHRWWFGCCGFFSFLSSFCFPRSGSLTTPGSVYRVRQTARATLNCFEIEGTVIVHIMIPLRLIF